MIVEVGAEWPERFGTMESAWKQFRAAMDEQPIESDGLSKTITFKGLTAQQAHSLDRALRDLHKTKGYRVQCAPRADGDMWVLHARKVATQ